MNDNVGTVGELIEELKKYNPNTRVSVGLDFDSGVSVTRRSKNEINFDVVKSDTWNDDEKEVVILW